MKAVACIPMYSPEICYEYGVINVFRSVDRVVLVIIEYPCLCYAHSFPCKTITLDGAAAVFDQCT